MSHTGYFKYLKKSTPYEVCKWNMGVKIHPMDGLLSDYRKKTKIHGGSNYY